MTQPQKNTLLVVALVASVVSLFLTWMTIQQVSLPGVENSFLADMVQRLPMTVFVDGLNGSFRIFVSIPIWLLLLMGACSSAMQLLPQLLPNWSGWKTFAVSPAAEWALALGAFLLMSWGILGNATSDSVKLGIGAFVGMLSAAIPVFTSLYKKDNDSSVS